MKNNINEITSSDFRQKIKSLGFTEKGTELTSGGEINSCLLDIMNNLVTDWKKMGGSNCPLKFTSGNDKFHKTIKTYVSRHTKGEAMDVTLPSGCHTNFLKLLNDYKSKYNGFSFIDEYRNPTKKATGGHFHMSYRAGQPEVGSKSGGGDAPTINGVPQDYTSQINNMDIDTDSTENRGESLLKGILSKSLGIDSLAKSFAGINEEITRIKKLML